MTKVFVMDHPLIHHKLTILRNEKTGSKEFRNLISEIATLMCYEATRDLPMKEVETKTPICVAKTKVIIAYFIYLKSIPQTNIIDNIDTNITIAVPKSG